MSKIEKLTPGQRIMVEDGLPAAALLSDEERRAGWKGRKLTKMIPDPKAPKKNEDAATKALRKELAAADAKRKAERLDRLRELKEQHKPMEASMATKKAKKAAAKKAPAKKAAKKVSPIEAASGANTEARRDRPVNEVVARIAKMMQRKNGASMEEMVEETGVEAHPMRAKIKQVRDKLGLRTEAPSKENGGRYFIRDVPPAGKDFAAQQAAVHAPETK